tara:strand:- start:522 stop:1229 length:708 start_codon:yes stop_codon:yes gene_type:complete
MKFYDIIKHVVTTIGFLFASVFWGVAMIPSVLFFTRWLESHKYNYYLENILGTAIVCGLCLTLWLFTIMILTGVLGFIFRPRNREGNRYPLYSPTTVKWAILSVIQRLASPFGSLFAATWVITVYYKLLGTRIGKNVIVNTHRIWDAYLINIDDNAIVGGNAKISGHLVEKDELVLAPVYIGKRSVIGSNSLISPGCRIGDDSVIATHAVLPKFTEVPAGEVWGGIPAKKIKDVK